jgi:hypothetical protein
MIVRTEKQLKLVDGPSQSSTKIRIVLDNQAGEVTKRRARLTVAQPPLG